MSPSYVFISTSAPSARLTTLKARIAIEDLLDVLAASPERQGEIAHLYRLARAMEGVRQ